MKKVYWIALGGMSLALFALASFTRLHVVESATPVEPLAGEWVSSEPLSICSQHAPKCPLNPAGWLGELGGWQYTGKKWTWVPGTPNRYDRQVVWEFSQPYAGTTPEYFGQREDHYTLDPDDPLKTYDWERWSQEGDHFRVMQLGNKSESEAYLIGDTDCSTGLFYPVVDHQMPFYSTPMFTNRWGTCSGGGYIAAHLYQLWGEPLSKKRLELCDNPLNGMPADLSPAGNAICKISPYVGVIFQRYIFGARSATETPSVGCEAVLYAWGYAEPIAPPSGQGYQTWFRNGELRFTRWYDLSDQVTPTTIPAPDDHAWWDARCQNAWLGEGNWLYSGVFRVGKSVYTDLASLPAVNTTQITPAGGVVELPQVSLSLNFAPGVFTQTVQLVEFIPDAGDLPPFPGRFRVGTAFYLFAEQADGNEIVQPLAPYTMTLQYADDLVGSSEGSLRLYGWDGRRWVEESSSQLDVEGNTLTATPDHFSLWALMVDDQRLFLPHISR